MIDFLSTSQLADLLGISRVAVFQKIKKGDIPAQKVGRNFVIAKRDVAHLLSDELTKKEKDQISAVVKKTVREYGDALRLLGKE